MSESTLFEHWSRGNDLLFTDFRFDSFALNRAKRFPSGIICTFNDPLHIRFSTL